MQILPSTVSDAAAWRRRLHRHPELGFELPMTRSLVAETLGALGLDVDEDVGGGVVGVLRRGPGSRRIALRADMDALPITEENPFKHRSCHAGQMHACGHDGHTAMLLGAARELVRREDLDAVVTFVFQPDEEHGGGARSMVEAGLFERFEIDEIYGLHNRPGLPVGTFATRRGPIASAEDNFRIELKGAGGHAAAPHLGNEVLVAACHVVTALQTVVSRRVDPLESAVLSVTGFETDGARNVLPGRCVLTGDVRSFTDQVQALVEQRLRQVVEGVAGAFGATATVSYTREFAPTVNSPEETGRACLAAGRAGCRVIGDCAPSMGSDDFGVFLQHRPGAYAQLGNGAAGEPGSAPLHSPVYEFNDAALPYGIGYFVALAAGPQP